MATNPEDTRNRAIERATPRLALKSLISPLNLTVAKTLAWGRTPLKVELDLNYYVEQPDAFGPEWMIGLNITPVVANFINNWIRGNWCCECITQARLKNAPFTGAVSSHQNTLETPS